MSTDIKFWINEEKGIMIIRWGMEKAYISSMDTINCRLFHCLKTLNIIQSLLAWIQPQDVTRLRHSLKKNLGWSVRQLCWLFGQLGQSVGQLGWLVGQLGQSVRQLGWLVSQETWIVGQPIKPLNSWGSLPRQKGLLEMAQFYFATTWKTISKQTYISYHWSESLPSTTVSVKITDLISKSVPCVSTFSLIACPCLENTGRLLLSGALLLAFEVMSDVLVLVLIDHLLNLVLYLSHAARAVDADLFESEIYFLFLNPRYLTVLLQEYSP